MAEWKQIILPVTSYLSADPSQLPPLLAGRLVDCYIDRIPAGDGSEIINLIKRPGLTQFLDLGTGAGIDGLFWWDHKNVLIAISAGKSFKITTSTGDYSEITGSDTPETGSPVTFATDGTYLVFANGGRMSLYNNSGNPSYVADADAPTTVSHVAFLDDYILANEVGTQMWWWADNGDPTSWDGSSAISAESKPDYLLSLLVANREIGLFGKESIEFWYNDGDTPFSRLEPVFVERGCYAKHSVQNYLGTWIWVDDRRRVTRMDARTPYPISDALDNIVRDMNSISDAQAFIIDIGKKAFYVLNFPTEDRTFVYDILSPAWYEWGKWDSSVGSYKRFQGANYAYCKDWGFHCIGDYNDGIIYKMDPAIYQDASSDIRTLIRTGNITHGTMTRKRSNELIIRLKRGLAAATQQLTDGGLETWASATNLTNWTETIAGSSTVNRESTSVFQGDYACRIDIDSSNNNGYISQSFTLSQNIEYTLSLWYKMSVVDKTAFVFIADSADNVALQSDGTWASYAASVFIPLSNYTDWTQLLLKFKAHASYSNYKILIGHTSDRTTATSSSIYIDDLHVEKAPQMMVRWRNEQQAWSDEKQLPIGLGKTGEYNIVQRLNRLGIYRARQYEFVHSDNTHFIVEALEENIDGLR